jgi:hypothetical protein
MEGVPMLSCTRIALNEQVTWLTSRHWQRSKAIAWARNAYGRAFRAKPSAKSLIRLAWFSMPPAMERAVTYLMSASVAQKCQLKAALQQ